MTGGAASLPKLSMTRRWAPKTSPSLRATSSRNSLRSTNVELKKIRTSVLSSAIALPASGASYFETHSSLVRHHPAVIRSRDRRSVQPESSTVNPVKRTILKRLLLEHSADKKISAGPDEPTSVASCNELVNFPTHGVSPLARKENTHFLHTAWPSRQALICWLADRP